MSSDYLISLYSVSCSLQNSPQSTVSLGRLSEGHRGPYFLNRSFQFQDLKKKKKKTVIQYLHLKLLCSAQISWSDPGIRQSLWLSLHKKNGINLLCKEKYASEWHASVLSKGASGTRTDKYENSACVSRRMHLHPEQPLCASTSLLSTEWSHSKLKLLSFSSDIASSSRDLWVTYSYRFH